ncbi:caspase family protein [Nostoc sp. 'Peltigera malacea cyanobiont' DB3992]|uniref:caspase family protein n=1 Tax=Nostoc sp. 'Peltigera malacea cyanobiont' DB3992 TaxID=1206980 RepID=UPI00211EBCD5|nr:caspase family protein [Nostoc sp. 'Peltigera malacea cyanobiont' DB3992]
MTKVALLIGISDYEVGLNPLPASVKDMQAIAKVLQHPEMGDFCPNRYPKNWKIPILRKCKKRSRCC